MFRAVSAALLRRSALGTVRLRRCASAGVLRLPTLPSTLEALEAEFPSTFEQRVEYRDLDAMNHVNNATYFMYFENARIRAFLGGKFAFNPAGVSPVLADTWCSFRRPVELDDMLTIGSRAENINPERGSFDHRYIVWSARHGTVAAQGGATVVLCDFDAGGRRTTIPPLWLKWLEREVAPGGDSGAASA